MEPLTRNGGFIGATLDFASEERYLIAGGSADITHVGTTSKGGGTSLTLPSGLQQNDLVMVFMGDDDNNGGSAPAGWTTLVIENFATNLWNSVWYKIMGAVPDTSVSLPASAAWIATAFRGVDTSTPFDVPFVGPETDADVRPNPPPITTVTDGCMIVASGGLDDFNVAGSVLPPINYTLAAAEDLDGTIMVAYRKQTTAGTENPGTFDLGGQEDNVLAYTFALRPGTGFVEGNYKNSGIWDLQSVYESLAAVPSYAIGLSDSLDTVSGQNDAWTQRTVDISAYAGATVRLVFGYLSGSSFTGDIQLDGISIDGNTYTFETSNESFETSTSSTSTYDGVTWGAVQTGGLNGQWGRDSGGTPSTGTGRTDAADGTFYVFAETSGVGNPSYYFWLRSPEITLGSSPTLTYYEARLGATIGTLNVYLDVIS